MNVLVDTSIWSLALRRSRSQLAADIVELRDLIKAHRVQIIGPIRQELLSGIRNPKFFERLERDLAAFPDLQLESADFVDAARFYNLCRAQGIQGSNTDFLICATASRRNLAIYSNDRDFSYYAKHLPIKLYSAMSK
jgi:predicted nucleic acid-binding protein